METVIIKSVTDGRMDGRTDGWTDGEPDGHHHTIIRPVFNWRIKTALSACFDKILSLISKIQGKKLPSQLDVKEN